MSHSMSMTITPLNFLAGSQTLGYLNEGWTLDDAPHGSPERSFRSRVAFERAFTSTPLVHLGIAGFDVSNQDSARVASRAWGLLSSSAITVRLAPSPVAIRRTPSA